VKQITVQMLRNELQSLHKLRNIPNFTEYEDVMSMAVTFDTAVIEPKDNLLDRFFFEFFL
jgi:hypothetical protein